VLAVGGVVGTVSGATRAGAVAIGAGVLTTGAGVLPTERLATELGTPASDDGVRATSMVEREIVGDS